MKTRYILYLLLLFMVSSCTESIVGEPESEKVRVRLDLTPTGISGVQELSMESAIETLDLLIFRNGLYQETVGGVVNVVGAYTYEFEVEPYKEPVTFLILANCREELNLYHPVPGTTLEAVKKGVIAAFDDEGWNKAYLPMSAEQTFAVLLDDVRVMDLALTRCVAKVKVKLSEQVASQFELKTMQVVRANDQIQLFQNNWEGGTVTQASIPNGAENHIDTPTLETEDGIMYVPESVATDLTEAMYVVIGGFRSGGTDMEYYRLDFKDESKNEYHPVLRNKQYTFTVKSISPGRPTPEIPDPNPIPVEVEVVDWEDDSFGNPSNYMTVSSHTINLHFYKNSTSTIRLISNLTGYTIEWCNENGISLGGGKKGWNEKLTNDKFVVDIEENGTVIRASALTENETNQMRSSYVLVSSMDDKIRFVVTINQSTREMRSHIHVFNYTMTWGGIGDDYLDVATNSVDPFSIYGKGLGDILRNRNNFGPNGIVPFAGFYISGLPTQTELSPYLLDLFDVVMIPATSSNVVSDQEAQNLLTWLNNKSNRVLIVHHDFGRNQNILANLGVVTTSLSLNNSSKYALSSPPHSFMQNGPFGVINAPFNVPDPGVVGTFYTTDYPDITPILVNAANSEQIIIGVDFKRRIIYCGDYRLYTPKSFTGQVTGNGLIETSHDRVLANLWAWIAEWVLEDDHDLDV